MYCIRHIPSGQQLWTDSGAMFFNTWPDKTHFSWWQRYRLNRKAQKVIKWLKRDEINNADTILKQMLEASGQDKNKE
jgi:hypothetical protein